MTYAQKLHDEGLQKGLEKGLEKGLWKGLQDAIVTTLEVRFGKVPDGLVEEIRTITEPSRLKELQRISVTSASFDQFAASL